MLIEELLLKFVARSVSDDNRKNFKNRRNMILRLVRIGAALESQRTQIVT